MSNPVYSKMVMRFFAANHILAAFLILYLSGCASLPEHKPKGELSPTQRAYMVKGRWYKPLATSSGYIERGIASWYGDNFHGRKTSSGETYNMNAMTAAHKTLPLNTYVKVTRLDTNKDVILRINDRGPFVKGRIIDLSYKAAKKLDMVEEGTAPVVVEALGTRVGNSFVSKDYSVGSFTVQVGAFKIKENALMLMDRLQKNFKDAKIELYDNGYETFYRVRVGRYLTLSDAERARESLERLGLDSSFVVAD